MTLGASICILVCKFGVKISLELTWWLFLCVLRNWGYLCLLATGFLFLCFPGGSSVHWHCLRRLICVAWGSPATCLICLAVAFELSIFLVSWCTLFAGNLSRSTSLFINSFGHKFLISYKELEDIMVHNFSSFQRVLGQIDLGMHHIVSFINTVIALSKAC